MEKQGAFWAQWIKKTGSKTSLFTKGKLATGFCMAVIVRSALLFFSGQSFKLTDLWRDLLIIVGSYATVILFSFIINFFRVPGILYREQADVIARLTAVPPISPKEQRQVEVVCKKLEGFSDKEKMVFRHIWEYGSINNHTMSNAGLDGNATVEVLRKGVQQGLLLVTSDAKSRFGVEPFIANYEWRINPDLESAFTYLFTEARPLPSPAPKSSN